MSSSITDIKKRCLFFRVFVDCGLEDENWFTRKQEYWLLLIIKCVCSCRFYSISAYSAVYDTQRESNDIKLNILLYVMSSIAGSYVEH